MSDRRRARGGWAAVALAAAASVWSGCASRRGEVPYPHESLLSIIAEVKIALRRDVHREAPGRDLNGRNIFRVTLERLDAVDALAGAEYDDVLAFTRAECHERLGEWVPAVSEFGRVIGAGTSLSEAARPRREWAVRLAEADSETTEALTLSARTNVLDLRRAALLRIAGEKPPFPYDGFIRRSLESNLQEKARFLFDNRWLIPRGAEDAIAAAEKLTEENGVSWRQGENWLLLASIHEGLARDYEQFNDPAGAGFDLAAWSGIMERAREACRRAAQADGDPAKPEAQARLRALDAHALKIAELAR